ncbi:MAG TPA: ornithine carbamoyltransferase [Bryobacteraceae bacterium]|nr:ornithine carbamoyltransferase [Bryobacteraceae bacterium]
MATATLRPMLKTQAQDFTRDTDLTGEELAQLVELTLKIKRTPARYAKVLTGSYISLLFEKPSLRTRLTFELAIKQLGGDAVAQVGPIGDREPLKDVARNLDRWTQAIVARTFSQKTIDELARWSSVPVINALSDLWHPCQALADVVTIRERFGRLNNLKIAFVGDGNNVAHSLMITSLRLGANFALATPNGYEAKPEIIAQAYDIARERGLQLQLTNDPCEAVSGAHAVYTDVWASMGQENQAAERREIFRDYQVNEALMGQARPDAMFMHCLPAKRDEETTDGVMESPASAVYDQAENRLHAQKALLLMLLGN